MELLEIKGLKLKSENKKGIPREFAIDIEELKVNISDQVLVLADRGGGKSPLNAALKSLFNSSTYSGENLDFQQSDNNKPSIHVDSFNRNEHSSFHEQEGNPESLKRITNVKTLVYCDDPLYPNTQTNSGHDIIDIAHERSLTLMLTADPDRLEDTLRYFISQSLNGRIIWLENGRIFWEGSSENFRVYEMELCKNYKRTCKNITPDFNKKYFCIYKLFIYLIFRIW